MIGQNRVVACFFIVTVLALSGCGTVSHGGAPKSSFKIQNDIDALEKAFAPAASIEKANALGATVESRNSFIDGRLALYNIRYVEFIQTLGVDKQVLDTSSDIMLLGLNTAGMLTGGVRAKANLAAAATLITGSKTSIDKNFYFEKTMPALVATMNNQRKSVLIRIIDGRNDDLKNYSMTQALGDLYDYEHAGTLIGAINTIQAEAGIKGAELDNDIRYILPATKQTRIDKKRVVIAVANIISDKTMADEFKRIELNRILKAVGSPKSDYARVGEAEIAIEALARKIGDDDVKKWLAALALTP